MCRVGARCLVCTVASRCLVCKVGLLCRVYGGCTVFGVYGGFTVSCAEENILLIISNVCIFDEHKCILKNVKFIPSPGCSFRFPGSV